MTIDNNALIQLKLNCCYSIATVCQILGMTRREIRQLEKTNELWPTITSRNHFSATAIWWYARDFVADDFKAPLSVLMEEAEQLRESRYRAATQRVGQ